MTFLQAHLSILIFSEVHCKLKMLRTLNEEPCERVQGAVAVQSAGAFGRLGVTLSH